MSPQTPINQPLTQPETFPDLMIQRRKVSLPLLNLANLFTATVTVTWAKPFPTTEYDLEYSVFQVPLSLGLTVRELVWRKDSCDIRIDSLVAVTAGQGYLRVWGVWGFEVWPG